MENSCYGCTKRKVGCHSNCEDYKEWLEEHHKIKKERQRKEKKYYDYFYK